MILSTQAIDQVSTQASKTHTVTESDGASHIISSKIRKYTLDESYEMYEESHAKLSYEKYATLLNIIGPDVTYVQCGTYILLFDF